MQIPPARWRCGLLSVRCCYPDPIRDDILPRLDWHHVRSYTTDSQSRLPTFTLTRTFRFFILLRCALLRWQMTTICLQRFAHSLDEKQMVVWSANVPSAESFRFHTYSYPSRSC